MNYCRHDIVLYLGKSTKISKYRISYDRKYMCAYCGTKNVFSGNKIKQSIDLSYKNINWEDYKILYKEFKKANDNTSKFLHEENIKNCDFSK